MKQLRKLFRQYNGFLVSILIYIVIIAGVVFGFIPTTKAILSMRSSTGEAKDQIELLQQKAEVLENIDEIRYKQYLSELSLAVPTDKSLTSLFSTIDGLSMETGVLLSDFTLAKPGSIATESAKKMSNEEKKIGSSFLPFTLTVTGSYDQIRKFVELSIKVRRFFRIRMFSITFSPNETISVQMGMDAYYAPLPTNLGSATQKIEPLGANDEAIISAIIGMPVLGKEQLTATSEQTKPVDTQPRQDPFSP